MADHRRTYSVTDQLTDWQTDCQPIAAVNLIINLVTFFLSHFQVLNYLLDHRLQPSLLVLYGPQLTGQLTIAHAHLMIAIAATVYAIPADCHQEYVLIYN